MSTQRKILALMTDNRERTFNDVANRVKSYDGHGIQETLELFVRRKLLTSDSAAKGITIYRKAQ